MGQTYYNEWINYSKPYYKFKVGYTALFRIYNTELTVLGLSNEPAQNFQLWRNGKEISLYTSSTTGTLGANGYIEFWAEKNDGKNDIDLYRRPEYQLSNAVSLIADTASFFLTTNSTSSNLRYAATPNNVAGNTLPAESSFMYSVRNDFKDRIHRGKALVAGTEYVYSSSYDIGEMWTSNDIYSSTPYSFNFNNLFVASGGLNATLKAAMVGSAPNSRQYNIEVNNTVIVDSSINQFDAGLNSRPTVPVSLLSSNVASIRIVNKSNNINDRIVCGFVELTYSRQFNFGNQTTFSFSLPASASKKYLEITNFNAGNSIPVLYDVTNQLRYVADVSGSTDRFVILPSTSVAKFVLVSQDVTTIYAATNLKQTNFINYSSSSNQGDYLIITHNSLRQPYSGADQVDAYATYRKSVNGGSFNVKIIDIDQLNDQFGYGIKKNPLGIKNFLKFARATFSTQPKYAFIVGKGMTYAEYRENEASPFADRLNLVPTWGYPASDVLLASDNMNPVMNTLISRLSVVTPKELADYLDKVKQYEQAQQSNLQTIENKIWMKNIVHVVGANDPNLDQGLSNYMKNYERIIEDTLFGGNVTSFNKTATGPVTPIVNSLMSNLFEKGISLLTYFGHSSASSLDYNLDDPYTYNNTGKYPVFLVGGCNAGNLYSFDTSRFSVLETLSEKFVLAKNKGVIGFIASTHFGIDTYLDFYNRAFYKSLATTGYGKSLTFNISESINAMNAAYGTDILGGRLHSEETTLNGDPALKINSHAKADFVIEPTQIQIAPNILSVADSKFTLKAQAFNIGEAYGDSVLLQIKHRYPNGAEEMLFNKKIKSIRYMDSITLDVPIVANRDKGENAIIVTVDADDQYSEMSEANNTAIKTFIIFEDELTPVYPYNYAIVNKQNIKLAASTANPLVGNRQYLMEMDTTALFNSSFKVSKNIISFGGLIEFDPGITFKDSTVYYWRVAPASSTDIRWKNASFVYLNGSSLGFNQSHVYQHTNSIGNDIYMDSVSRLWKFAIKPNTLTIVNSIFGFSGNEDNQFSVAINGLIKATSACLGHSVVFNVIDPMTLQLLYNQANPSTTQMGSLGGFMGSANSCGNLRQFNFEFSYLDSTGRRLMRDFIDWVPSGYYVTMRLVLDQPFASTPFVNQWINDRLTYGNGNTLYDRLKTAGFTDLDSYTSPRTWAFVFRKNNTSFQAASEMSNGLSDRINLTATIGVSATIGSITSPSFGPAKVWKQVKWRGFSMEANPKDVYAVYVIGITPTNQEDTLFTLTPNQQDFNISSVSAIQYPYIKLGMKNQEFDSVALTPYQLRYWRVLYDPIPEGALAPNITFSMKDTFDIGDKIDFKIAFKNISEAAFADSIKVNMVLIDQNNVSYTLPVSKLKKLQPGDTSLITYPLNTKSLVGNNSLFVDVNPAFAQPEQYRFNNVMYKNFYVKGDTYNPLLDVTFDGVHILNGDIVSAKPKIVIKLKDESKFLAIDDTSLAQVFVQYPGFNGQLLRFAYNTDTLKFIPANLASGKNEATIEFTPAFLEDSDGDFYELIVRAKDKSGNAAGNLEYRVRFQIYNKPMISNMFNYPNPFTTSTAFVFTVTGSQVPQNIRIQIMTITGKIVKEITTQELGPLHIGRNITDYKWDGTDQYGQKLGNGVYLYRMITNLNGVSLDKFKTTDSNGNNVDTDKYFKKGYGKMYLMR